MNDTYRNIIEKTKKIAKQVPESGFEIRYLENAEEILSLYRRANGIVDEYEETKPDLMQETLEEILAEMNEV